MLVEAMSPSEVTKAIISDLVSLNNKTLPRLVKEYDKSRRKKKIQKVAPFHLTYEVKPASKNNWIYFLSKSPAVGKYQSPENVACSCVVYYYTSKGLRVFSMVNNGTNGIVTVYNGHLFTRYNERKKLNLKHPLEIVKHFFINNCYGMGKVIVKDGKEYTVCKCLDGFMLGELQHGGKWWVQKTFISNEMKREDQTEIESEIIGQLNHDIIRELNKPASDLFQKRLNLSIKQMLK